MLKLTFHLNWKDFSSFPEKRAPKENYLQVQLEILYLLESRALEESPLTKDDLIKLGEGKITREFPRCQKKNHFTNRI